MKESVLQKHKNDLDGWERDFKYKEFKKRIVEIGKPITGKTRSVRHSRHPTRMLESHDNAHQKVLMGVNSKL